VIDRGLLCGTGALIAAIIAAAQAVIADLLGVSLAVRVAWEPTVTDPTPPLFATPPRAAVWVLGTEPALNRRVAASDAGLVDSPASRPPCSARRRLASAEAMCTC
jgi:hypothetical protein